MKIVEQHHQVLEFWAAYRRQLDHAPAALTLDHHTDTLPAFGRAAADEETRQKWIAGVDFRKAQTVTEALRVLRHDEHLDLALRSGMISRSVVIAHYDNPGCANDKIQVVAPDWPDLTELLNAPERFRPLASSVLEDCFLEPLLCKADFVPEENPGFILDIDMDYVLTGDVFLPERASVFRRLLRLAGLITVSREDIWLRLLRIDPDWDFNKAEAALRRFINNQPLHSGV
ncbi:MAG: UPF0489 family protein [Lentisphaeria bacterium]|nr:UPF0489 family protein [Lentisphaeria bacterium]